MSTRSRGFAVLVASVLALGGCRRDTLKLDEVQKMAYSVKPGVVRVNAYATAEFRYTGKAISAVEAAMRDGGREVTARSVPAVDAGAETGAGGSGSGFIVHPDGFILTNDHVVAATRHAATLEQDLRRNGAIAALVQHFPVEELRALYREDELDRYIALLATAGRLENVQSINEVELSNGEKLPFRVQRYSPPLSESGSDLAVLRVDRRNLPVLRMGDSEAVGVGESLWAIGYPAVASSTDDVIGGWLSRDSDLEATFNPGTITALKRTNANAPVFQSNVAIYRGNSGGPAVNRAGEVIGIATWGHTNAEQIKFLVPVNVAKTFLGEAGVRPNVESDFNRYYQAALDEAGEGRWTGARKNLANAALVFPNSPDVIRFRRDVDRAMLNGGSGRVSMAAMVGGGTAVAVAIVGAAAFMARSRRPRFPRDVMNGQTQAVMVAPNGTQKSAQTILGKLTILNGERAGEKLGLGGSGIRIGRESAICEIVLENPKVSRLHAEVVSIDGKVMLIDRNSSNGTYVNDQKIDRRFLKDGDIIHFGGRNAIAVAFHA